MCILTSGHLFAETDKSFECSTCIVQSLGYEIPAKRPALASCVCGPLTAEGRERERGAEYTFQLVITNPRLGSSLEAPQPS